MDTIVEGLLELVIEIVFCLTVENPRVKTWVKTAVFLLIMESMAAAFLWLGFSMSAQMAVPWAVRLVGVGMAVFFLIAAIRGHRRNWKQK